MTSNRTQLSDVKLSINDSGKVDSGSVGNPRGIASRAFSPLKLSPVSEKSTLGNISGNRIKLTAYGGEESKIQALSPDMLLSPSFVNSPDSSNPQRSTLRMASSLPVVLWRMISYLLGVTRGKRKLSRVPVLVSTVLKIMTFVAALCFGVSGMILNVYEAVSEFTKITELVCIVKSVVGLSWIFLGVYSYSLAKRSFTSKFLLSYIRFHSKKFMKISISIWIAILAVGVVGTNIYSNANLVVDGLAEEGNVSHIGQAYYYTCSNVNLEDAVCKIYFGSKVTFCILNLLWILVVTAVCLSVCRTHAICIRRFIKELYYDSVIFEEFNKLKMCQRQSVSESQKTRGSFSPFENVYDDDVFPHEEELEPPSNRRRVSNRLRKLRKSIAIANTSGTDDSMASGDPFGNSQRSGRHWQHGPSQRLQSDEAVSTTLKVINEGKEDGGDSKEDTGNSPHSSSDRDSYTLPDLSKMEAPIMSPEDLIFIYFKTVKILSTTSVMLQRWMSVSMAFVVMWCILLVVYWTAHPVEMLDIVQFLVPLIVLGFLISAYAEVNFEGQRLHKYILPTEGRSLILSYTEKVQPQLKVYDHYLTFSVLATVIAGVALTFASKIILANT